MTGTTQYVADDSSSQRLTFWKLRIRHLTTSAKREDRGPDTVVAGTLLHAYLDLFTLNPRDELVSRGSSADKLPDPELLSWLRVSRHLAHNYMFIDSHETSLSRLHIVRVIYQLDCSDSRSGPITSTQPESVHRATVLCCKRTRVCCSARQQYPASR